MDGSTQKQRHQALGELATTAREGTSPLERLEIGLHPWVAFLIMPLFPLANAGVGIEVASLGSPVAIAVAASLVLGTPIGIVLFSWIATKLGFAPLPAEVNWKIMLGAGCLAGIGFAKATGDLLPRILRLWPRMGATFRRRSSRGSDKPSLGRPQARPLGTAGAITRATSALRRLRLER